MGKKMPGWLTKKYPSENKQKEIREILDKLKINTVCQEACCPNIGECFAKKTATFMILGKNCTRNCKFCAVSSQKPEAVNHDEPKNIALAVKKLNLKYVVITSVTRDDLPDGGIGQFINTSKEISERTSDVIIELLTPDFKGDYKILKKLKTVDIDVFSHNIEVVPRLYKIARPAANYERSLHVLSMLNSFSQNMLIKSGIMVGLGESEEEVIETLKDLKETGCDTLTIGQYLQPSKNQLEVKEYITPRQFKKYKDVAIKIGFISVASGPFVRSSYKAKEIWSNL